MDDSDSDDMDSGVHRYQLRFLSLFVFPEVGAGNLAGRTQLPRRGLRHGQVLRVVVGSGSAPFAAPRRHAHVGLDGLCRLWPSVARHS